MAHATFGSRASIFPTSEADLENTVQTAEDMARTYNWLGRLRNSAWRLVASLICAVILFLGGYGFCANFLWDMGGLHVTNVGMQALHVDINNDSRSYANIGGNTTLVTSFRLSEGVKMPQPGHFTLAATIFEDHPIEASTKRVLEITGNEPQLVAVTFRPSQTQLTEDELPTFQKRLNGKIFWIRVTGDFPWELERQFLVFRKTRGVAQLKCEISYTDILHGKIKDGVCVVS